VPPIPTDTRVELQHFPTYSHLRLTSEDGTNRLTRRCVQALAELVVSLRSAAQPLIITGSGNFFSAGADLAEIRALDGPSAYEFAKMGQRLMLVIEQFPAPVYAAIHGYCMGGGLDLALACHRRIASPLAVFGHRGAALGLMTGWGGTQRLPRLVGGARALEIFASAEKIRACQALAIGLVEAISEDPVANAIRSIESAARNSDGVPPSVPSASGPRAHRETS
jgi:enoyl-CoA hydratase/carnithine racemase